MEDVRLKPDIRRIANSIRRIMSIDHACCHAGRRRAGTRDLRPVLRGDAGLVRDRGARRSKRCERRIATTLEFFPWLIAEEGGRVLGYAYASRHRERAAYRWSADVSVYVREDARGKGIGRALYTSLFAILRLQGIYNILAGITFRIPPAWRFMKRWACGFGLYTAIGYKCGAWHDVGWWQICASPACRTAGRSDWISGDSRWC